MIEIKAPNAVPQQADGCIRVFLAGSIEMGKAVDWQTRFTEAVADIKDLIVLNPRRDDWDSGWEQSINNPQFKRQVDWELDNIEDVDWAVFYFDPATMSPITLMELGTRSWPTRTIVCCPKDFWRRGNVEIFCARQAHPLVDTLEELIQKFRLALSK